MCVYIYWITPFIGSLSLAGGGGSLEAPIAHGWEHFQGQLAFQPAFTAELFFLKVNPLALDMGVSPVYRLLKPNPF